MYISRPSNLNAILQATEELMNNNNDDLQPDDPFLSAKDEITGSPDRWYFPTSTTAAISQRQKKRTNRSASTSDSVISELVFKGMQNHYQKGSNRDHHHKGSKSWDVHNDDMNNDVNNGNNAKRQQRTFDAKPDFLGSLKMPAAVAASSSSTCYSSNRCSSGVAAVDELKGLCGESDENSLGSFDSDIFDSERMEDDDVDIQMQPLHDSWLSFQPFKELASPAASSKPTASSTSTEINVPFMPPAKKQKTLSQFLAPTAKAATKRRLSPFRFSAASTTSSSTTVNSNNNSNSEGRFRAFQAEQWNERYDELLDFRNQFGHCMVPNSYKKKPTLFRWVKRQRYQFKLLKEGKQSTMTDERIHALQSIGFVWDTLSAQWEERLDELKQYHAVNGHCNVPSTYGVNPKLAIWVKCQRRQYKKLVSNQPSNITPERIQKLNRIGFVWEARSATASYPNRLLSV